MTTEETSVNNLQIHRLNSQEQLEAAMIPANSLALISVDPSIDEINILHGLTTTTEELNYCDGVTSNIQTQLDGKQDTLVSGTNIKTINGISVLGSGNVTLDGQWVSSWYTLTSSSSETAETTYSLSSYLPNDDYNYEVLIYGQINIVSNQGGYRNLEIGSSIIPKMTVCAIRQSSATYTATTTGTVLLPVGTDRNIIKLARTSDAGTYALYAIGYRRIGSNS